MTGRRRRLRLDGLRPDPEIGGRAGTGLGTPKAWKGERLASLGRPEMEQAMIPHPRSTGSTTEIVPRCTRSWRLVRRSGAMFFAPPALRIWPRPPKALVSAGGSYRWQSSWTG